METKKFFFDSETFYEVRESGHRFTILQDTPARYITILADGRHVCYPECSTLEDAVAQALEQCK